MTWSIFPDAPSVSENTGFVDFTVFRTHATTLTERVYFSTLLNGGTNNNDYTSILDREIVFAPGIAVQTVRVFITPDSNIEFDETFAVIIQQSFGQDPSIFLDKSFFTIVNDDFPPPGTVSISNAVITEGNAGATFATFTVTRAGGTTPFNISYSTADGSATAGDSDYVTQAGILGFGFGINTQTFSIQINGDTNVESNETFAVNLFGATNGAVISDSQGIGTITNDDSTPPPPGSVSISNATITEGNSGTKIATFTVARAGGTGAFSVNFDTADGSATIANGDYSANSGTLFFAAGDNQETISVTINGDADVEPNETFLVNLSGLTNGATFSDSQGVGTITNDDVAPSTDYQALLTGTDKSWSGTSTANSPAFVTYSFDTSTVSYAASEGATNFRALTVPEQLLAKSAFDKADYPTSSGDCRKSLILKSRG